MNMWVRSDGSADDAVEWLAPARERLREWIDRERSEYADVKYANDGENVHKLLIDMRQFGLTGGEWEVFLGNYLRRAQIFGLDTPAGRQAFGKYVVTCMHALEMATVTFGDLPAPGVPSGEIDVWEVSDGQS